MGKSKKKILKDKYVLVIPALIVLFLVIVYPLYESLKSSFYYYVLSKPFYRPFIWFQNYQKVLSTNLVWISFKVTMQYTIGVLIIQVILAFIIAYALQRVRKFNNAILSVLIIPVMLSGVAVGLIWNLLLHTDMGIVNYVLGKLGIPSRAWLATTDTALPTLIFIEVWRSTPFLVLTIYSSLLSMPIEPFEAATLDGANEFQKIWYLVFPFVKPVLVVSVTIRFIDLLRTYDLVYTTTRGGPATATNLLSFYIWQVGFTNLDIGKSSALSYLMIVFITVICLVLYRRINKGDSSFD